MNFMKAVCGCVLNMMAGYSESSSVRILPSILLLMCIFSASWLPTSQFFFQRRIPVCTLYFAQILQYLLCQERSTGHDGTDFSSCCLQYSLLYKIQLHTVYIFGVFLLSTDAVVEEAIRSEVPASLVQVIRHHGAADISLCRVLMMALDSLLEGCECHTVQCYYS